MEIRYSLELLRPAEGSLSRRQLEQGCYRIGRGEDCEIQCLVPGVSRQHAEIEVLSSGGLVVRDLGSTNGTRVNGRRIEAVGVGGDCVLDLGAAVIRLREHDRALSTLAHVTGQPVGGNLTTDPVVDQGTQALSLGSSLREALWSSIGITSTEFSATATRVLSVWLESLQVTGLRLVDSSGRVLAAAGDQAVEWQRVGNRDELVLEISGGSDRIAAVDAVLAPLLAWLPRLPPAPVVGEVETPDFPGVATSHAELRRQLAALRRVAASKVSILLLGETGVGKDLLAQWLHDSSPRKGKPFVAINCAALPQDLLEAELFGVEEGAATGVSARPGVFERADGGTLFLDELGDMSLDTQVRLLRALEDGQIHRLGGKQLRRVDIRLISATNQSLDQAIADKRFRLDLYHRVAGFETIIPPLRERGGDIAPLVIHFYTQALQENGLQSPGITQAALLALQQWHWPGNIRELKQSIQGAVAMLQQGEALDRTHLPVRIAEQDLDLVARGIPDAVNGTGTLAEALEEAERSILSAAIASSDSDEQAWQCLGIGKTSFYKKVKQYGLK